MTRLQLGLLGTTLALLVACGPATSGHGTTSAAGPPDADSMEELLEAIAAAERPPGDLEVVYDDMHGLHGGETITLHGDGTIQAVRREPPDSPQLEYEAQVEPADLLEIVELLLDIEAWEQEVPERILVPDESMARLHVRGAGLEAGMWEFYNDLEGLGRLVRVKRALEALAFPAP